MDARPYETLLVTAQGPIATITISVPERRNALSPVVVNELLWALDDARDDGEVRVVVLTGAGGTFCAGGDLKRMGGEAKLEPRGDFVDLLLRFTTLGKPTIARVEGYAMGGGLGLVAACDFAVATDQAVLGTPEIERGLFPMMIMAVLARVVPQRALMEMMLLGERMTAAQALQVGLLSRVVTPDALDAEVARLADGLAAKSPTAMRMGLEAFHHQRDMRLEEAVPYLRDRLFALLGTEDAREGLAAFFEKRAPRFTGR